MAARTLAGRITFDSVWGWRRRRRDDGYYGQGDFRARRVRRRDGTGVAGRGRRYRDGEARETGRGRRGERDGTGTAGRGRRPGEGVVRPGRAGRRFFMIIVVVTISFTARRRRPRNKRVLYTCITMIMYTTTAVVITFCRSPFSVHGGIGATATVRNTFFAPPKRPVNSNSRRRHASYGGNYSDPRRATRTQPEGAVSWSGPLPLPPSIDQI